jgi:hypothetical protein
VILVGSSLTRNAVPAEFVLSNRAVRRYALSSLTESETLNILEQVIANASTQLVIVEMRVFAFDFRSHVVGSFAQFKTGFMRQRSAVNQGIWHLLGGYPYSFDWESPDFLETTRIDYVFPANLDLDAFSLVFPLQPKQPSQGDRLRHAIELATQRNIKLIFVDFPRAKSAVMRLSKLDLVEMEKQKEWFASEFGVDIWTPATSWPDSFFLDHAHFNGNGRNRFVDLMASTIERSQWIK